MVALLARLALYPQRSHPRETLCELLWPEVEPEVARTRLRHTLRSLRSQLEADQPAGSVLIADRLSVCINPAALTTDVALFEQAVRKGDTQTARALYTGELLPGLWDDWIVEERHRLTALADLLPEPSSPPVVPNPDPRPHRTLELLPLALPTYLTSFLGRVPEKDKLTTLLETARLVTLTGVGGTGKTRLAVELLRQLAPRYERAAFISLAECLTPSQLLGRLRGALGLPSGDTDPLEQVCWHLQEVPSLLVLDNLEQLVDLGADAVIGALLQRLPQLTILATSRRAVGIAGEQLFPLEPLGQSDAEALFVARVQATRPGFHLTDGNRTDVAAVCQGLEGIPLAIELAAARIRVFSPAEMCRELDRRFEWLARTGLKGDKDDRHRSLVATLEWSWRLLSPSQQQFLANLALFRAPWTATEAAALTACSDARERLEALESDSLIAPDGDSQQTRYTMLTLVRDFARERLTEGSEARQRFRAHYLSNPTRDENTPTAWQYALDDCDADAAYGFAYRYELDWTGRLGVARALDFIAPTCALPCPDPQRKLHADLLYAECLLRNTERTKAMALMAEAVAPLEAIGGELLAEGLRLQAQIGLYDAPPEVTLALLERCLTLAHTPYQRAEALRIKGCLLCQTPRYEEAEPLFDEAETLFGPSDPGQRRLLNHRAHLAKRRGQHEESLRLYTLSAEQARAADDPILARNSQSNIPDALASLKRWDDAIREGLRCLEVEEAHGDRHLILCLLWNLAFPLLGVGKSEQATRLLSAAATHWERDVRPLSEEDLSDITRFREELIAQRDTTAFESLWSEGATLTLKQALALARTT